MIWLLFILITPDKSSQVSLVGNPLGHYHSCGGNNNISVAFVSGLLTEEDVIQYNFNIEAQHQKHAQINNSRFDYTDIMVFEIIDRSAFNVNLLNGAIVSMKSKYTVFDDFEQPDCLWQMNNYMKLPSRAVFSKYTGWGFDFQDVILQQITIPVVSELTFLKNNPYFFHKKLNFVNFYGDSDNSVCSGDSGGGLVVSGWGVVNTTKVLPTRRCHWPAFWLVVCPWYGIRHCQSKIL